jgi:hypothetical protein
MAATAASKTACICNRRKPLPHVLPAQGAQSDALRFLKPLFALEGKRFDCASAVWSCIIKMNVRRVACSPAHEAVPRFLWCFPGKKTIHL